MNKICAVNRVLFYSFILLLFSGCDWLKDEEKYKGFAKTHFEMNARPENFENYIRDQEPQNDDDFFDCLDENLDRINRDILANIAVCDEECDDDAVCELDCNTQLGTDFLEADESLIMLERAAIKGQVSYADASAAGQTVSDLVCLSVNASLEVTGSPLLTCDEVWSELRTDYIKKYTCKYSEYFWE